MRGLSGSVKSQKKRRTAVRLLLISSVVGADGFEPPTYAL
jgi:hypothetical protein